MHHDYLLQDGLVYAVEFSHRSGRDLINVAKKRTNIIPIIEDARHPHKYRMLLGKDKSPGLRSAATIYSCSIKTVLIKFLSWAVADISIHYWIRKNGK